MATPLNIAIVGGGIAGLALALGLHRHGITAKVYEAAPQITEIGVGITLLPHGMRELATLGLSDAMLATGIENRESAFFNRFGQLIFSSTDSYKGWDGNYNSMPQPTGVYVYQLEMVNAQGKRIVKQGTVTLLR